MSDPQWFAKLGAAVADVDRLTAEAAKQFAAALREGVIPGARFISARETNNSSAIEIEVDVERPQELAHPIRGTEPIAVLFPFDEGQPGVFALREDFPDSNHQNWTPPDVPCSLCVDDRPWNEARLTSTAPDLVRRIQLWLAKAAKGELHDPSQPADPIFYMSPLAIIVPPAALTESDSQLSCFLRRNNDQLIIMRHTAEAAGMAAPDFNVMTFEALPQAMRRVRHAPRNLKELADELLPLGIDLIDELRTRIKGWGGGSAENIRRLDARLALIVSFPIAVDAERTVNDLRAFVTFETAGELGVALGVLERTPGGMNSGSFMPLVVSAQPRDLANNQIEAAQTHFAFHRALAASIAGVGRSDQRRTVLVGAGSLGSQLALNLAREGRFDWTVIDDDVILPHNLARHGLLAGDVGAPKAAALAGQLGALLGEKFTAIRSDVVRPKPEAIEPIAQAVTDAEIIIDASASVAVSRHLADLSETKARRVSTFFNPEGTAVILLAERADRTITLRDLEAQYYRLVLSEPALANHLIGQEGVRYSGSCRSLTNRIPATRASLLSAIASRGIVDALSCPDASVKIWTAHDNGRVELVERTGEKTHTVHLIDWSITYDDGLLGSLSALRESRLPSETGGVLLGIADMHARKIHIAYAMPQPSDSRGSPTEFERGVVGVSATVGAAVEATMHQLRYIGEWHSHPCRASVNPSATDVAQLMWLGEELRAEGLPALMAIAGDDGKFAILVKPEEAPAQTVQQAAGAR